MTWIFLFPMIFGYLLLMIFTFSNMEFSDTNYVNLPHNNGKIAKIEFEGHSYIGWTCNCGCSLIHDPNCSCVKKIKNGFDLDRHKAEGE